jgi:protein NrfD
VIDGRAAIGRFVIFHRHVNPQSHVLNNSPIPNRQSQSSIPDPQSGNPMSLATVLSYFLIHLGIGISFTLALVSREAGVKFFRFNAGLAAILIAIGFAFREPLGADATLVQQAGLATLFVCEAALVVFWATVGRALARLRPALVAVSVIAGVLTLTLHGLDVPLRGGAPMRALAVASFVTSAALLGGACGAMILGHWYLILPSMDVALLQSIVKFHIVSMVVRTVVVVTAVFLAIAIWQPGTGPSFQRYITSLDGIFFWQRVLFGLAGPAVLSYLIWETAKIRSTQSATGILYVDFFTVVVGEVLAKYLLLATSVPL